MPKRGPQPVKDAYAEEDISNFEDEGWLLTQMRVAHSENLKERRRYGPRYLQALFQSFILKPDRVRSEGGWPTSSGRRSTKPYMLTDVCRMLRDWIALDVR
jgi:hypothetical protein